MPATTLFWKLAPGLAPLLLQGRGRTLSLDCYKHMSHPEAGASLDAARPPGGYLDPIALIAPHGMPSITRCSASNPNLTAPAQDYLGL
jgi:hypothetical protein